MVDIDSNDAYNHFVSNELPIDLIPCADCVTLAKAVAVSRVWRRCTVQQVRKLGPHMWLESHRSKLEMDALDLCRLSAMSSWYDDRHMSVALIVDGGGNPLNHAMAALEKLHYVPLPPPGSRADLVTSDARYAAMMDGSREGNSDDAEDCWIITSSRQVEHAGEAEFLKELRRQWTAAYMSADCEDWNDSAQLLCVDTLAYWHALCCCVMCSSSHSSLRMRRYDAMFKHSSLRGTEWWKADMLMIGTWQYGPARGAGMPNTLQQCGYAEELEYVSDPLTAVCFTYWQRRTLG